MSLNGNPEKGQREVFESAKSHKKSALGCPSALVV